MNTPTQTLRVVFSLSALACSVVLMLFVRGRAEWTDAFWLQLAAASVALCVAGCFVAFRNGGLRLEAVPLGRFILVFLRQLAITYIASGVAVSVLALAVIYAITRSGPNALALAVLAGLWLSLWLAPGIASFTTWRNRFNSGNIAATGPYRAAKSALIRRLSRGLTLPVKMANTKSPTATEAGKVKSQSRRSSARLTSDPNARAALAYAALKSGESVATTVKSAFTGLCASASACSHVSCPALASSAKRSVTVGLMMVTLAPSPRNSSARRSATAPPPTTTQVFAVVRIAIVIIVSPSPS